MKKLLLGAIFSISIATAAFGGLKHRVNGIIRQSSQKKVQFSVSIVNAESGETVYSHNSSRALVPASNMKVITSAAALEYLGADYVYTTKIGLVDNSLVVIGSGDPLLGDKINDAKIGREDSWIPEEIAESIKKSGKKSIKDIIVDSSIFDDERVHPSWAKKELNRSYACEVSGLNFHGNCVAVGAKSSGGKVNLLLEPQTDYVKVINQSRPTSKSPNTLWCARPGGTNTITVRGKCYKSCKPIRVTIERPAVFFGFLVAESLTQAGIKTDGVLVEKNVEIGRGFKLLKEYTTSIVDCLGRCNKDSFGLAAEALLKTVGAKGRGGSWAGGRGAISEYLLGLGIKKEEFYIDDGSGLSRGNKLSARAITKVLLSVYNSDDWELYKNSLAVGGTEGTIRKHFKQKKYKGKVFGKSGYINGVKSLSGVCSTADGDYIFSVLTNKANGKTRGAINSIVKAIIDSNS